ncbi:MAG: T9SS type A sorting domain-containing protein [Bacteroidales bacterium]|nr:T9SS type A sorting domain-containing protein [Bacteroidales bacterium]MCF8403300.1 T9SS type A sorting domain-containing protein [Bacteroidales bacterium]
MRKLLLFMLVIGLGLTVLAQQRVIPAKSIRDKVYTKSAAIKDVGNNFSTTIVPGTKSTNLMVDTQIGGTIYDLQTNVSCENRLYLYEDGSMGGVWTQGFNPTGYAQRGTGYNYFDGSNWGPEPTVRIEDTKTGWPAYTPYGENGELFVCHHMLDGLLYGIREEKGTGEWAIDIQAGPSGAQDISWPRGITSGPDNNIIHFLSVTYVAYNGQDNALLYSRSSDGGATWDPENYTFDELGANNYTNMGGDIYDFAQPKNGTVAFLVGDNWTDLVLMKSTDDGDSWESTIVWECPYPLNTGMPTDTFYSPDGSHHLAIDNNGLIHVVFGLTRSITQDWTTFSYYPGVDGVVYWNETMPGFSDDINALNPYGHPDSELIDDYNLIGWSQDVNGNGELDILDDLPSYNAGLSSKVQIIIDDMNQMFLVYSSLTETFDNGIQNYRHIWIRASVDGGTTWGPFYDMNMDLVYIFDECVFPSVSPTTDDNIYFMYQADNEPGMSVQGDADPPGDNFIRVMKIAKEEVIDGIRKRDVISNLNISQNQPNPFNGTSTVNVALDKPAELSLEVTNLVGQIVYQLPAKTYTAGNAKLVIEAQNLNSGVYFYTVKSGNTAVTKKMIVE